MDDIYCDEGPRIFKGKHINSGEWVKGFYHEFVGPNGSFSVINFQQKDYVVHPDSVCLGTGIFDKNRQMIFENDICEFQILNEKPILVAIKYCYGAFGFQPIYPEEVCEEDRSWTPFMRDVEDPWDTNYFKVIGNKFDFVENKDEENEED